MTATPWRSDLENMPKGLIDHPQFFGVDEATCVVYEHDEGEAIALARCRLDRDASQWVTIGWLPMSLVLTATEMQRALEVAFAELGRVEDARTYKTLALVRATIAKSKGIA